MITKDEVKAVVMKHAKDVWTKTNVPIGVDVEAEASGDGQPQFSVKSKLGTIQADPAAVEDIADIIALSLMDILPRLSVNTTVACSVVGSLAEGKGSGSVS